MCLWEKHQIFVQVPYYNTLKLKEKQIPFGINRIYNIKQTDRQNELTLTLSITKFAEYFFFNVVFVYF